jgi:hypothetical protein
MGNGSFFYLDTDGSALAVKNTTMKNGYHDSGGRTGAIAVDGVGSNLTLDGCTLVNNTAGPCGAIAVGPGSNLMLDGCTLINNTATAHQFGGGAVVFQPDSTGLIKGCSFVGPISETQNDIFQYGLYENATNVTFACAHGEVGTPVRVYSDEITVIPPIELQCKQPTDSM